MDAAENKMISIIVPVYMTEPYLRKCLDSIINQTYRDLEIILVDDGSPDGSPAVCDEYGEKDPRIRVIHKKNGGLSDARNCGLDIAAGEYIGFVDSDDWISPRMYENLMRVRDKYDVKIACCSQVATDGERETEPRDAGEERCLSAAETFGEIFTSGRRNNVMMQNKIYASALFSGIRFPVGELHEDIGTFYKLIGQCDRIACTGTTEYYYRRRPDSITGRAYSPETTETVFRNLENIRSYLEENCPEALPAARQYEAEMAYNTIACYLQSGGKKNTDEYRKLKKHFREYLPLILRHKKLKADKKVKAVLIRTGLYGTVRNVFKR